MRKVDRSQRYWVRNGRVKDVFMPERSGDGAVVDVTRRVERASVGKLKTGPKQRDPTRKL
jgi:hypothetical protein